jgi:hypothetical protein
LAQPARRSQATTWAWAAKAPAAGLLPPASISAVRRDQRPPALEPSYKRPKFRGAEGNPSSFSPSPAAALSSLPRFLLATASNTESEVEPGHDGGRRRCAASRRRARAPLAGARATVERCAVVPCGPARAPPPLLSPWPAATPPSPASSR